MTDDKGEIRTEFSEGVVRLTINRTPLNILNIAFMEQIDTVLTGAPIESARVLAIGAEGKAFCAGVDVADHTPEKTERMIEVFHRVIRRIRGLPIPTVALVQGAALGGGFELACSCDLMFASENAKFGVPEISLGVYPPVAVVDLPRIIGSRKAAQLILCGGIITAPEAEQCGLVNTVFSRDEFVGRCSEILGQIASRSRAALVITKAAMRESQRCGEDWERALQCTERRYLESIMTTNDAHEGIAAFLEHRPPVWQHR